MLVLRYFPFFFFFDLIELNSFIFFPKLLNYGDAIQNVWNYFEQIVLFILCRGGICSLSPELVSTYWVNGKIF